MIARKTGRGSVGGAGGTTSCGSSEMTSSSDDSDPATSIGSVTGSAVGEAVEHAGQVRRQAGTDEDDVDVGEHRAVEGRGRPELDLLEQVDADGAVVAVLGHASPGRRRRARPAERRRAAGGGPAAGWGGTGAPGSRPSGR